MNSDMDEYRADEGTGVPGGSRRGSLRNLRTFTSLKNAAYRVYLAAMASEMAAMNMQLVARSVLVYRLTGSAAILGGIALANAVPMLFLALFGGVIADRVQKKHVIVVGHVASAVASLGIAFSLTTGYLSAAHEGSWWILIAAAVFQGAVMGLIMPSRESLIREIVSAEHLLNAISLNDMGVNSLRLFAPALTGFLIDAFDFAAVYYVMAGTYLLAALFMVFLPHISEIATSKASVLTNIMEGFRYIRRETTIRFVLIFLLLGIVLSQPYILLMPVFCDDILKKGATGMGILMSVSGAGAIVGSLILASLPNRKRGLIMLVSTVLLGVSLAAFSLSESWPVSLGVIVFVGLGQTGLMAVSGTLIQYYVDPKYLSRVISILMMQFGLISFGTFAAGLLAEAVGVQWAVGGFAIALALVAVSALAFATRVRNLE